MLETRQQGVGICDTSIGANCTCVLQLGCTIQNKSLVQYPKHSRRPLLTYVHIGHLVQLPKWGTSTATLRTNDSKTLHGSGAKFLTSGQYYWLTTLSNQVMIPARGIRLVDFKQCITVLVWAKMFGVCSILWGRALWGFLAQWKWGGNSTRVSPTTPAVQPGAMATVEATSTA